MKKLFILLKGHLLSIFICFTFCDVFTFENPFFKFLLCFWGRSISRDVPTRATLNSVTIHFFFFFFCFFFFISFTIVSNTRCYVIQQILNMMYLHCIYLYLQVICLSEKYRKGCAWLVCNKKKKKREKWIKINKNENENKNEKMQNHPRLLQHFSSVTAHTQYPIPNTPPLPYSEERLIILWMSFIFTCVANASHKIKEIHFNNFWHRRRPLCCQWVCVCAAPYLLCASKLWKIS